MILQNVSMESKGPDETVCMRRMDILHMLDGSFSLDAAQVTLRKHAYTNILKILPPKNENFQVKKKSDFFLISAQNIDCGYSLEPP